MPRTSVIRLLTEADLLLLLESFPSQRLALVASGIPLVLRTDAEIRQALGSFPWRFCDGSPTLTTSFRTGLASQGLASQGLAPQAGPLVPQAGPSTIVTRKIGSIAGALWLCYSARLPTTRPLVAQLSGLLRYPAFLNGQPLDVRISNLSFASAPSEASLREVSLREPCLAEPAHFQNLLSSIPSLHFRDNPTALAALGNADPASDPALAPDFDPRAIGRPSQALAKQERASQERASHDSQPSQDLASQNLPQTTPSETSDCAPEAKPWKAKPWKASEVLEHFLGSSQQRHRKPD